jgi:hypothetical protein
MPPLTIKPRAIPMETPVARDNAPGREDVGKVLSPELSASLSAEHFTTSLTSLTSRP